jgi:hypothetical protein
MMRSDSVIEALNDGTMMPTFAFHQPKPLVISKDLSKVDVVLWVRNPGGLLEWVLRRIEQVIPKEYINQKIVVIDRCYDSTSWWCYKLGWKKVECNGWGISDAANSALSLVETHYFCSVEQDVILARNWWDHVSKLITKQGVAAVSGVRYLPENHFCYNIERYNSQHQPEYGKTLDNTIWNTEALRSIGGFPKLTNAGLDTYLSEKLRCSGYQWLVDTDVQSLHVHKGLHSELMRYRFYGLSLPELNSRLIEFSKTCDTPDERSLFIKFIKSPIAGLKLCRAMGDSRLLLSYPLVRLYWLLGYLRGKGKLDEN